MRTGTTFQIDTFIHVRTGEALRGLRIPPNVRDERLAMSETRLGPGCSTDWLAGDGDPAVG